MYQSGAIAVPTREGGWVGRLHRDDSRPGLLGATLVALYHAAFERDLDAMTAVLIDAHPAGWITVTRAPIEPAFIRNDFDHAEFLPPGDNRVGTIPQCRCHGRQIEPYLDTFTCRCPAEHTDCLPQTIAWVYVLTPSHISVRAARHSPTLNRVVHAQVAEVYWNRSAPDWTAVERHGEPRR